MIFEGVLVTGGGGVVSRVEDFRGILVNIDEVNVVCFNAELNNADLMVSR
jgi:hypothetical protein